MRIMLAALALASGALTATAQPPVPSDGYRVCAPEQTMQGRTIVREACGDLVQPDFAEGGFASLSELEAAGEARETFLAEITAYAACVSGFIDAARQPGMPADSLAPDQAARLWPRLYRLFQPLDDGFKPDALVWRVLPDGNRK